MFERLDEHVAATQVEYLGPKTLVSRTGAHQNARRERKFLGTIQEIPPVSVRMVSLASHNRYRLPAEKCQRLTAACAPVQLPVGMSKNLTQGNLILSAKAHQQNGRWLIGSRNGIVRSRVHFVFVKAHPSPARTTKRFGAEPTK